MGGNRGPLGGLIGDTGKHRFYDRAAWGNLMDFSYLQCCQISQYNQQVFHLCESLNNSKFKRYELILLSNKFQKRCKAKLVSVHKPIQVK